MVLDAIIGAACPNITMEIAKEIFNTKKNNDDFTS